MPTQMAHFQCIIADDIVEKNVMIMKWETAWCKQAKAANTIPKKSPGPEESPPQEHRISVCLTQVCHEPAQQMNPSKPPKPQVWNSNSSQ